MRTSQNHSAVLTNVMRPVMTTGVVSTPTFHRHHPIILPKPPILPSTSGIQKVPTAVSISNVSSVQTQSVSKKKRQITTKKNGILLAVTTKENPPQSISVQDSNAMKTPSRLFRSNCSSCEPIS